MGEYAEMMLDGTCCAGCGEYMGDSTGYPGYCSKSCARGAGLADEVVSARKQHSHWCQTCGKGFKHSISRDQHAAAKHGTVPPQPLT